MAAFNLDSDWSDAIVVPAGAIVQNKGAATVLVSASNPPSDDDALELPVHKALRAEAEMTIRARSFSKRGLLGVVEGL